MTTTDAGTVAALAHAVVAVDPVANTVFGSIAAAVHEPDAAPWAAHAAAAPSVLAARSSAHTTIALIPGWPIALLEDLADAIDAMTPSAVGLGGPPDAVARVADRLGKPVTERMDERLFRLDELLAPPRPEGGARMAGARDAGWLARWYTAFVVEAFGRLPPGFDAMQMVQRGVRRSRCWIWTDPPGAPRSMAVAHPAVAGVSRIGPVYTPPEARGHGYGSAVTAAASRDILESGNIACLYTDLANPTSNRIYRAIGYRPVLDRASVRFD
jgi:predicted GNAT family acetyltransferase